MLVLVNLEEKIIALGMEISIGILNDSYDHVLHIYIYICVW